MIEIVEGDLLEANTDALVNTVNTFGTMGKGIALCFKEKYPNNFLLYKKACLERKVNIGKMFITEEGGKIIINFPTKKHWRMPSQYSYIEEGLISLVDTIKIHGIKSLSLPMLGCGNGGLDPAVVETMIIEYLTMEGIEIKLYK